MYRILAGVLVFGPEDIDDDFRKANGMTSADNADTLSVERGVGLWLWKPYVIRKALMMLEEVRVVSRSRVGLVPCACDESGHTIL
jgi:hypothetical protein